VLQDLQEDPNAAQQHLRNPGIRAKITKLASAGVIQLR
jgi:stress-induced-phosphoprotein 1